MESLIDPTTLQTLALWFLGLLLVLCIGALVWLDRQSHSWQSVKDWFKKNYVAIVWGLGGILACLAFWKYIAEIALSLVGIVDRLEAAAWTSGADAEVIKNLAYATAVLGGILAASTTLLFSLLRVWINDRNVQAAERTTKATEEGLITDRINTAVAGLGAEKNVKTKYKKETVEHTEPNLEVRTGALFALQRIMEDSDRDRPQIIQIISAYIRNNAGYARELPKGDHTDPTVWLRVKALRPRADIDIALKILEKLPDDAPPDDPRRPDLQAADLRGLDLRWRNLSHMTLMDAQMQGTDLYDAKMRGADLRYAKIQGANLSGAEMQGAFLNSAQMQVANLIGAEMQGADLIAAKMQGADLFEAHMQGANLIGAQMQGADLSGAQMQGADLQRAVFDAQTDISLSYFQGANFRGADVSQTPEIADHQDQIFSVPPNARQPTRLPDGVDAPAHWLHDNLSPRDYKTAWRDWQKNTLRMAPDGSDIP
jgi:uncharacterized protein YjbI with pentapeptide repeats